METKQEQQTETPDIIFREDHPWLEVPASSLDEDLRYTLDEIRIV